MSIPQAPVVRFINFERDFMLSVPFHYLLIFCNGICRSSVRAAIKLIVPAKRNSSPGNVYGFMRHLRPFNKVSCAGITTEQGIVAAACCFINGFKIFRFPQRNSSCAILLFFYFIRTEKTLLGILIRSDGNDIHCFRERNFSGPLHSRFDCRQAEMMAEKRIRTIESYSVDEILWRNFIFFYFFHFPFEKRGYVFSRLETPECSFKQSAFTGDFGGRRCSTKYKSFILPSVFFDLFF
ncbi:hypothetical protein ES703_86691 [subsurface metagenome]